MTAPTETPAAGTAATRDSADVSVGLRASDAKPKNALRPFAIISLAYLLFTVTDGAVRMLVLLHAYTRASPWRWR